MRREDMALGAGVSLIGPVGMLWAERVSPSYVGRGGFAPIMRLNCAIGVIAGFIIAFNQSQCMWPSSYHFHIHVRRILCPRKYNTLALTAPQILRC